MRQMTVWMGAWGAVALFVAGGCEEQAPPAPPAAVSPPAPLPPPPGTAPTPAPSVAVPPTLPPAAPPAAVPPLAASPAVPPAGVSTTVGPQVRLSTGVALPQTTVEGTLMSFSVDYRVMQGAPSGARYLWVIERGHGPGVEQEVALGQADTLYILLPGWLPGEGPWRCWIDAVDGDGSRRTCSNTIELR